MHVAELNIGRLNYPIDDPRMADFVDNLGRINAMAERMPGFVWRLVGDGSNGGSLDVRPYADPMMAVNMSVWQTVEQLEKFVWQTVHQRFLQSQGRVVRADEVASFRDVAGRRGQIPTLDEAKARLEHLEAHGNSDFAYDWAHLEHIKLWMSQRCG